MGKNAASHLPAALPSGAQPACSGRSLAPVIDINIRHIGRKPQPQTLMLIEPRLRRAASSLLWDSTLSIQQEKLLENHFQRVVLMLDGDKVGISAATTIAAQLTRKLFVKVVDVPAGRQPDQMSTEEIRVLLMQPIYP